MSSAKGKNRRDVSHVFIISVLRDSLISISLPLLYGLAYNLSYSSWVFTSLGTRFNALSFLISLSLSINTKHYSLGAQGMDLQRFRHWGYPVSYWWAKRPITIISWLLTIVFLYYQRSYREIDIVHHLMESLL